MCPDTVVLLAALRADSEPCLKLYSPIQHLVLPDGYGESNFQMGIRLRYRTHYRRRTFPTYYVGDSRWADLAGALEREFSAEDLELGIKSSQKRLMG